MLRVVIAGAGALGVDLCLALLLPFGSIRLDRRSWRRWSAAFVLAGALAGVAAGVGAGLLTTPSRLAAEGVVGAAMGLAVLNLGPTSRWRRLVAGATVFSLSVAGAGVILSTTTRDASAASATSVRHSRAAPAPVPWRPSIEHSGPGYVGLVRWSVPRFSSSGRPPVAAMVRGSGEVGSVVIPADASHFRARPAIVYLPPAALVPGSPRLPVVIALSGQSRGAGPMDVAGQGQIAATMDRIARAHHGVAPIVVIPDQLGPRSGNPMCVDSRLGAVATYITVDVRRWILTRLPAAKDRRDWTIAGFSEGGTCSIQFAARRPDLFGSLIDVSGEQAPKNGTVAHTIAVGFDGSPGRYAAAAPFRLLATHHYPDMRAYFSAGALDTEYGPVAPVMAGRARAAGMTVQYRVLPGLKHNWRVGRAGFAWGLDALQTWWPAEVTGRRHR